MTTSGFSARSAPAYAGSCLRSPMISRAPDIGVVPLWKIVRSGAALKGPRHTDGTGDTEAARHNSTRCRPMNPDPPIRRMRTTLN